MKSFILKIQVFSFFNQLVFAYPIYSIMFSENGLNTAQIGFLLSMWAFTALILEVPLGVIADKYDRKIVLIFGTIFKMLVFVTWILSPNFLGYLIGFIFWGISGALLSGTFEAFVYDEMVRFNKESEYESIMGGISSLRNLGVALALVLGGVLSEVSYWFVLTLSAISSVASAVIMTSIKSTKSVKSTGEKSLINDIREIIPQILKTKNLLYLSLIFVLLFGVYGAIDEFYPLLFNYLDVSKSWIGVLGMTGYLFASLGGWLISKEKVQNKFSLFYVTIFALTCYLGLYYFKNTFFIALHYPLAAVFAMTEVYLIARMQRYFKSSVRATSLSIINMFKEVVVILATLAIGAISVGSIWNTFAVGSVILVLVLLLSLMGRKVMGGTREYGI